MQSFSEWLQKTDPEFCEGLFDRLYKPAKKVVGASNTAIGIGGVVGRMYAPLVAGAMAVSGSPNVAPTYPLTNTPVDQIGSIIGHPDSQGWYDAADWIPTAQHDDLEQARKMAKRGSQQQYATGFADPNWRPKPISKKKSRRSSSA